METSRQRAPDLSGRDLGAFALAGAEAAVKALADFLGSGVVFNRPVIAMPAAADASSLLGVSYSMVGVRQEFRGAIAGHAWLIFPDESSLELIRMVIGEHLAFDDLLELETDALAEIGNVALNGFIGCIANSLNQTLPVSLPEITRGFARDFVKDEQPEALPKRVVVTVDYGISPGDTGNCVKLVLAIERE